MPAKKDSRQRQKRINELLHRISQIDSLESEMASSVDLGKSNRPLCVSLESFIQFNFDLSQDLDHFIEEKMLDEYQKEWDEWGTVESDTSESLGTSRFDLPNRPK